MAEKDFRQLKGPDKAAILMLALGEEHSSKIWPLLDDEEIKEISQNMANLGSVNSETVEKLFLEFVNNFSSTGSLSGTFDSTERLLMKALPNDRVTQIMEETQLHLKTDHGGNPRSCRPHHVGQAGQRE
jgi:flagellar motor switch protein FliG